jgi:hypothetical protein
MQIQRQAILFPDSRRTGIVAAGKARRIRQADAALLGLLVAAERLPVYPIAILSYDTPRDLESDTFRIEFPDKVILVFHFTIIQLNRLK